MPTESTASAKEKVLKWVREKNPQTMEYSHTFKVRISNLDGLDRIVTVANEGTMDQIRSNPKIDDVEILGSDMGLQELLIAFGVDDYKLRAIKEGWVRIYKEDAALRDHTVDFDLTKDLHEQSPDFYQSLLPLIHD